MSSVPGIRPRRRRRASRRGPGVLLAVAALAAGASACGLDEGGPPAQGALGPLPTVAPTPPPSTAVPAGAPTRVAPTTTAPPTSARATTTTAPPTTRATTTVAPTLPEEPTEPIAPPVDPYAYEESELLGSFAIPKLGLEAAFLEGIRLVTLDQGPGHWPGSAMPGEVGNVVVAGHRVSHGGVFRYIDTLVEGDELVFDTETGTHTYRVTTTEIVEPDALWIVDPTDTPTATLFACHPPGSVSHRIVVKAELVT